MIKCVLIINQIRVHRRRLSLISGSYRGGCGPHRRPGGGRGTQGGVWGAAPWHASAARLAPRFSACACGPSWGWALVPAPWGWGWWGGWVGGAFLHPRQWFRRTVRGSHFGNPKRSCLGRARPLGTRVSRSKSLALCLHRPPLPLGRRPSPLRPHLQEGRPESLALAGGAVGPTPRDRAIWGEPGPGSPGHTEGLAFHRTHPGGQDAACHTRPGPGGGQR